jgi:thiosulfate/3-mercaptopyruvate sulfurtransferase
MQPKLITRALLFTAAALLCSAPHAFAQFPGNSPAAVSALSIPESQLIQAADLNRMLQAAGTDKPLVLQVGSRIFFAESHIAGSIFAGPGSQPAGLQLLQSKVASTDKKKLIVLYCGCCPWGRCPNVGPAFKQLHDLGFTNVKVLYLANNFGDDWVAKGYKVEHGQ